MMNEKKLTQYKYRLTGHRVFIEATAMISVMTAALIMIYWIGNTWMQMMLSLIWICFAVLAALYLKERVTSADLLTSVMYVFIASTFLNQALLSISAGSFTLFLYRLLLLVCMAVFLVHAARTGGFGHLWAASPIKGTLLFLLFWLAYAAVSLIWSWSIIEGMKYLLLLGIGIAFLFLAVFTFTTVRQMLVFHLIWLVMSGVLIFIGLINHFARIQLPTSSLYGGPDYKQGYPTAVFTNQNDFATLLAIAVFFYLAAARNIRQPLIRLINLLLAGLSVWLIVLTESRASLLGAVAGIAFYLFLMLPEKTRKGVFWAGVAAALTGMVVFSGKLFEKLQNVLGGPAVFSVNENPSSNTVRMNLLKSAWHYLGDSFGFGTGAGNIPVYLEHQPVRNTDQIFEVHNWLMELTGNFGFLFGAGYLAMYLALFAALLKIHSGKIGRSTRLLVETCMTAQVAFLVSSISPSSVSNLYFHWVFLGFVLCTVSVLYQSKSRERLSE
ncbi:O-antigen ligase family protein [Sporolactobacillus sp. CPB3-1]|uniref:O-antigen ligase family protein n=1 Tax=Sporolactobacillus mangiferae TaxID=2940498 RepID=A0ABT0MB86_9BACL|nr:O-antigen ligase family protein [Sporolactobacillus mangiferae]MCL1631549.1 O-antigen ligase family protein [Sporolactobacillus mangiferae]